MPPLTAEKEEQNMLELLIWIVFIILAVKAAGLALRLTWGAAKLVAALLFAVALPGMILVMLFAGGALLLIPLGLAAAALGILRHAI